MKKNLLFTLLIFTSIFSPLIKAQITKLSSTNFYGALVNNKPVLVNYARKTFWTTDGTPVGTVQYTSKVLSNIIDNNNARIMGGKLYFAGKNTAYGIELWVTDGTNAGTSLVKDIDTGSRSSSPTNFYLFNNELFFFANTAATGIELWKTNGTKAGTVMVKDINPGTNGSAVYYASLVYFENNGILYFAANDSTHGEELWRTDGSNEGTFMIKDINPGKGDAIFNFLGFGQAGGLGPITLFSAFSETGVELWRTDGTKDGTFQLKDISPDIYGSDPRGFTLFNNKVYFKAYDPEHGVELWVTDGTTAGTKLLKDINTGSGDSFPDLDASVVLGDKLVFTVYNNVTTDREPQLWVTDGTAAGTMLLKDISPGTGRPNYIYLLTHAPLQIARNYTLNHTAPFNSKIFFITGSEDHGTELWITDGTTANTTKVKTINPSSSPYNLFNKYYYSSSRIFFFASSTDSTGLELWKSDGTEAGTGVAADLNPRKSQLWPEFNFIYNNKLFITTADGDSSAFFALDENATLLPLTLLNFNASLQTVKTVSLEWNTFNEANTDHYEIERSTDGINFSAISKQSNNAGSSTKQHYQYSDQQAKQLNSLIVYYRLKMISKDGSYQYSKILPVHFNSGTIELSFTPNPVQNQLNIIVSTQQLKGANLRIIDMSGRQVYLQPLPSALSVSQQNINVSKWQKGVYSIQLITDRSIKTQKFVKQ